MADTCFAGVGINGHIAFNEPPERDVEISAENFYELPTRLVALSRETVIINSNTTMGGSFEQIPPYAVTVGMKQILGAGSIRIYMNRPWQSAVLKSCCTAR